MKRTAALVTGLILSGTLVAGVASAAPGRVVPKPKQVITQQFHPGPMWGAGR
jgi:hypothetical protein